MNRKANEEAGASYCHGQGINKNEIKKIIIKS